LPLLRDLHELRRVVEPAAVRLAAERAQADDLRAMEDALMAMTRAAEMAEAADAMLRRRPSRGMRESREALAAAGRDYVAADLRFHQALLGASHNQMMKQVGRALAPLLAMSFEMSSDHAQGAIGSLPMHRRVLDAVRARKPDAAARASLVLIDDAGADIERKHGPRHAPTQVK
jgi:DNA-binding FadR family transcriptional regulator